MTWIDRLFKDNKTKEIECELLDETDKSIKVNYGIHTTYLPKKIITFMRVNEGSIIKVRLPLWLYRKKFN
jgi:RNase P/RNase MRP subunit p29|tara:strand:- start:208 stop:417 length:210 start_codon:yes stop_codon:yes gene_type:complete